MSNSYTYSIKDRGGEETTLCHLPVDKQTAEEWRATDRALSDLSPISSFRIHGSRAGVASRSLPLRSALGLTEDAS